jgi:hypothetical protein
MTYADLLAALYRNMHRVSITDEDDNGNKKLDELLRSIALKNACHRDKFGTRRNCMNGKEKKTQNCYMVLFC